MFRVGQHPEVILLVPRWHYWSGLKHCYQQWKLHALHALSDHRRPLRRAVSCLFVRTVIRFFTPGRLPSAGRVELMPKFTLTSNSMPKMSGGQQTLLYEVMQAQGGPATFDEISGVDEPCQRESLAR